MQRVPNGSGGSPDTIGTVRSGPGDLGADDNELEFTQFVLDYWRGHPASSVQELIAVLVVEMNTMLKRSSVPEAPMAIGKATSSALAWFDPAEWQIFVDIDAMAGGAAEAGGSTKPITPTTKMSEIAIKPLSELAGTCYHEARHAEQNYLVARLRAQALLKRRGYSVSVPDELSATLGIPLRISDDAIADADFALSPKELAQARAWGSELSGGKHHDYRQWNEGFRTFVEGLVKTIPWEDLKTKDASFVGKIWGVIHPSIARWHTDDEKFARRKLVELSGIPADKADAVEKDLQATLIKTLEQLSEVTKADSELGIAIENARTRKPTDDDELEKLERTLDDVQANKQVLAIEIAMLSLKITLDDAYHNYPVEADAYAVEQKVKDDIQTNAALPW